MIGKARFGLKVNKMGPQIEHFFMNQSDEQELYFRIV